MRVIESTKIDNNQEEKVINKCTGLKKFNEKLEVTVCPLRNNCMRFKGKYHKDQSWVEFPYDEELKKCNEFIEI